ncbi:MAG: hypothetical protein KDK90_04510 [Leptospiraceae bacterium]|nr:hypothetical protein [Leptospiraceae bacterium]
MNNKPFIDIIFRILLILLFLSNCNESSNNNEEVIAAAAILASSSSSVTVSTLSVSGLNEPEDLEVDSSGVIYVTDSKNHKIKKISNETDVTVVADTNSGTSTALSNPEGICIDSSTGDVYVANTGSSSTTANNILKITSDGTTSLYAGPSSTSGERKTVDGTLTASYFNKPEGIFFDSKNSILYVGEANGNTVRKVISSGASTFAGSTSNVSGFQDGTGTSALFNSVKGVVTDSSGNIFVSDSGNNVIRKITSSGTVTTFAGSKAGTSGSADGTGTEATFNGPYGLAIDSSDNIYVADGSNNLIRKITSAGVVTTIAGIRNQSGSVDGDSSTATFNEPRGVAIYEKSGTKILYVTTTGGTASSDGTSTTDSKIRKITNL